MRISGGFPGFETEQSEQKGGCPVSLFGFIVRIEIGKGIEAGQAGQGSGVPHQCPA